MICDSCNRQLRDGAKFCGQCGAKTKLSHSAPVAGTSEQKYELNTLSVNATGPDSDGDLSVEIKVSITNRSGSDWDQVNTRTQLISASGFIAETSDTHDLVIEDGATEEFEMNFYGVKARPFMANPELTKTIINVVACSATSKKLGEIILPETSFEVVKIEPFEINASVKLLSGGVWKTDPDDDKEVYVEAKWLVQNLTDTHIPEVKFIAEVVGKSGDEIGDMSGYEELRQRATIVVSGSTYGKDKKLKGANIGLSVRVLSATANGALEYVGMDIQSSQMSSDGDELTDDSQDEGGMCADTSNKFNTPVLSEKIIFGIKMGNLIGGTGLEIKRYLRADSDGNLSSCVVYIEEWDDHKESCRVRGACYGYAGGGVFEGSFFLIDFNKEQHQVLDFSEADEDINSQLFNALMFECGRMYENEDENHRLTTYAENLLKSGDEVEDGIVYLDNDFDGDSLSQVSQNWTINLRFES